ncbi:hypothetical protein NDU88_007242 [Pleurodeles waltl]|uniref:Uncharacterized protein n=1 Tax=Pleurodeles waltl TaxID=8319 RepID=A0AAV7U0L0_PLEWA|nr:hypothetical protein NDU88_007242 [Pleurodeles waltl]
MGGEAGALSRHSPYQDSGGLRGSGLLPAPIPGPGNPGRAMDSHLLMVNKLPRPSATLCDLLRPLRAGGPAENGEASGEGQNARIDRRRGLGGSVQNLYKVAARQWQVLPTVPPPIRQTSERQMVDRRADRLVELAPLPHHLYCRSGLLPIPILYSGLSFRSSHGVSVSPLHGISRQSKQASAAMDCLQERRAEAWTSLSVSVRCTHTLLQSVRQVEASDCFGTSAQTRQVPQSTHVECLLFPSAI